MSFNPKESDDRPFVKATVVLVTGTTAAHLVTAVSLPVATRLYSPAEFNILSVFSAVTAVASVAACLRFDTAIPVTKTYDEARGALALALLSAVCIAFLAALVILAVPTAWLARTGLAVAAPYLWLLPPAILLSAGFSALQGWYVRESRFKAIANIRVVQSVTTAGAQLSIGAFALGPIGLLLGYVANFAAGCLLLSRSVSKDARLRDIDRAHLQTVGKAYHTFPKYSTLEALLNSAAIQAPVVLIAAWTNGPEAGHLMLAMYVMQVPMALIGTAVGQVYLAQGPQANARGALGEFTLSTLARLSKLGIGPLVFAGFVAPVAVATIFGSEWRRSGEMVALMTPWFIAQFLSSPLSMAIHIVRNQGIALSIQAFGLIVRVGMVYAAYLWFPSHIVEAYAASGFIFYSTYLAIVIVVLQLPWNQALRSLGAGLPATLVGTIAGLISIWLIR